MLRWDGRYDPATHGPDRSGTPSAATITAPTWGATWLLTTPSTSARGSIAPTAATPAGNPAGHATPHGIHRSRCGPTAASAAIG